MWLSVVARRVEVNPASFTIMYALSLCASVVAARGPIQPLRDGASATVLPRGMGMYRRQATAAAVRFGAGFSSQSGPRDGAMVEHVRCPSDLLWAVLRERPVVQSQLLSPA